MPSSGNSDPLASSEASPRADVITITANDQSVEFSTTTAGGQLLAARIGNYQVVEAIAKPTAVKTDDREIEPNAYEEGEVVPGGSWLSVDTKAARLELGDKTPRPVHGPQRQPWTRWIEHLRTLTSVILRHDHTDRDSQWFRPGEAYDFEREMVAESGQDGEPGALHISTTITSQSDRPYNLGDIVEHFYAKGGSDKAVLIDAQGNAVAPAALVDKRPAHKRNNAIDTRINAEINTEFIGVPGQIVFAPEGVDGHIVVLEAAVTLPDGTVVPVNDWCVYRQKAQDDWTALEPAMPNIPLQPGDRAKLEMRIRAFDSLDAYRAHQAARVA